MSRRHKLWAQAARKRMLAALGDRCAACGSTELLEFDCIHPALDDHHKGSAPERICYYRKQMRAGNIQCLCRSCNGVKGALSPQAWQQAVSSMINAHLELRLSATPGRDTPSLSAVRAEWLREFCAYRFGHADRFSEVSHAQ